MAVIRIGVIVAALTASFGAGWMVNGWRHDAALTAAREAQIETSKALTRTEVARLAAQASADALSQQLEDQAYADQGNQGSYPRVRVDRLRQR
jgi:hypothetical protein